MIDPRPTGEGLKKVEKRLDRTNVAANRLRRTMVGLLGSFIALAAIRGTLRVIGDFEQSLATIAAVTNATAREMSLMSQVAQELGRTTRFTASESANALVLLSRAGFSVAESTAAVASTLQLAQAAGIGLTQSTDILASALRGFRLAASEAGRVADVLAVASARANTTVLDLGQGMKFVAPISAGLSVSLELTAASMGVLSDAGLQASLAGTGLRRVLAELESPTSATVKIFDKLGITTDEVKVSQVGLVVALERLRDAGLDTGTALKVFGKRGGPAFEVMSANIPRIRTLTEELENSEGAAAAMARIMDDTLQGAAKRTLSAIQGFILGLEETFGISENLKTSLDFLAGTINVVSEAFGSGLKAAEAESALTGVGDQITRLTRDIGKIEKARLRQGFLSPGQVAQLERLQASLAQVRGEVRKNIDAAKDAAAAEKEAGLQRALAADKASEAAFDAADPLAKQLKLLREQNDVLGVAINKGAEAALLRQIELDLLDKKIQLTPVERAELEKLIALNESLNKELEKQQEITKVDVGFDQERVRAQVSSLLLQVGAASELQLQITELNRVFAEGTIDLETYGRALDLLTLRSLNASQELGDGFSRAFLKIKLEAQDLAAVGEQLVNVFADGATDAITELARTGKLEIKDLANSILDDLARILARLLVIQAISLFAGGGGGAGGNFIGPLLSQREHGGPVMANRAFLVGEGGPELFVPPTDGMIVPADRTAALAGQQGGGTTVIQAPAPEVNLTVNNISDPNETGASLASGENDREVLNILSRNRGKARQILA